MTVVATFYFPRAIHHGQGVMHPIIDERASDAQKEALFYILSGADQPVGTMFQIFSVIIETIKDPLFAPITFDWDLDKRQRPHRGTGCACARTASRSVTRSPMTEHQMTHGAAERLGVPRGRECRRLRQEHRSDPVRLEPTAQLDGERRLGTAGLGSQLRRVQAEIRQTITLTIAWTLLEGVLRRDRLVLITGVVTVVARCVALAAARRRYGA